MLSLVIVLRGSLMKNLLHYIRATITQGEESGYVGECHGVAIVTQGGTLDEVSLNLQEAVELYFEDENPEELGFVAKPLLMITIELQPAYA